MCYANYKVRYEYDVFLPRDAVLETTLHWTEYNCKYEWGWGHKDGKGYISFTCPHEALLFRLVWVDYYATNSYC